MSLKARVFCDLMEIRKIRVKVDDGYRVLSKHWQVRALNTAIQIAFSI
jgi:hypothetical protein